MVNESVNVGSISWVVSFALVLFCALIPCCCMVKVSQYSGGEYSVENQHRTLSWPKDLLKKKFLLTIYGFTLDALSMSALSFTVPARSSSSKFQGVSNVLNGLSLQFSVFSFQFFYWICVAIGFGGSIFYVAMDSYRTKKCSRDYDLQKQIHDSTTAIGKQVRRELFLIEIVFATLSFPIMRELLSVFVCNADNNLYADTNIECYGSYHISMMVVGGIACLFYIINSFQIQILSSAIRSSNVYTYADCMAYNGLPYGNLDNNYKAVSPVGIKIDWKALYSGIKLTAIVVTQFFGASYPMINLTFLFFAIGIILITTISMLPHNVRSINVYIFVCYASSMLSVIIAIVCVYNKGANDSWIPFYCWLFPSIALLFYGFAEIRKPIKPAWCCIYDHLEVSNCVLGLLTLPICCLILFPYSLNDHIRRKNANIDDVGLSLPPMYAVYQTLYDITPCCACCQEQLCPLPDYPERSGCVSASEFREGRAKGKQQYHDEQVATADRLLGEQRKNVDEVTENEMHKVRDSV